MQFTTLGRAGPTVSVAGLGCGGFSRLGLGQGKSEADAVRLVQAALDAGVTLLDTAASYGTEAVVGKALAGRDRDGVVLSTKAAVTRGKELVPLAEIRASLDGSLARLGTDHVDVFHLHGVPPFATSYAIHEVAPALDGARREGKLRHLGITEVPPRDPAHEMLPVAMQSGLFDVVMVAFHLMHQNARQRVLPLARELGVGTLLMFAVRRIFSEPQRLRHCVEQLVERGELPASLLEAADPLGFLVHEAGASSLIDAAYRYCRHEPGVDVVLFGTGSLAHLHGNLRSILAGPLPTPDRARIAQLFGHLVGVGLDAPSPPAPAHQP
jgi:aryl-alcohol dehydrogenase-like predicted oxidoreductase